jgi:hypothetical protein
VPKLHTRSLALALSRACRLLLGPALLFSISCANFPVAALADGPSCELECCAGRAPHAAGSCMGGSCHAFRTSQTKNFHQHEQAVEQPDELCGLSSPKLNSEKISRRILRLDFYERNEDREEKQLHVSKHVFRSACQPVCGTCAVGFVSKRHDKTFGLNQIGLPHATNLGGGYYLDRGLTRTLNARSRADAPRGPPAFLF